MDEKEDFIRLARAKNILSDERLQECVAEWEGIGGVSSGKHIWDIALEKKFLSPKAHARVAEHMGFIAMREEDKVRGEAAVRVGLVKAADLEVALFLQRKSYKDKREIKRIEEYLLGLNALQTDQVQAFREAASAPPPPLPVLEPAADAALREPAEPPAPPTREAVLLDDELTLDNPELLQKYLAEGNSPEGAPPGGAAPTLEEDLAVLEPISPEEAAPPAKEDSEFDDEQTFAADEDKDKRKPKK